jgi:cation diffusion facilitator family transporter
MTSQDAASQRAIVAAFLANFGIALAKFISFLATGATSMLAEAVHSVADTSNQGLLLLGGRKSRRAPSREHPFGYGRERYFWSFVVAVVLFTGGGLFALYEGEEKLRHPHELESVHWAIGVLLVAVVLEAFSLRTAAHESRAVKGSESWPSFIRRAKIPELPVVLLEDTGALLGLSLALLGVVLAEVTGNPRFDALGSIGIGILLGAIAVTLAVEMKSFLIGEAAAPEQVEKIRRAIESTSGVQRVVHLRTEHLGPEELLVAAKIAVDGRAASADTAALIDRAEAAVRSDVPQARIIYLEPDIDRTGAEPSA